MDGIAGGRNEVGWADVRDKINNIEHIAYFFLKMKPYIYVRRCICRIVYKYI